MDDEGNAIRQSEPIRLPLFDLMNNDDCKEMRIYHVFEGMSELRIK